MQAIRTQGKTEDSYTPRQARHQSPLPGLILVATLICLALCAGGAYLRLPKPAPATSASAHHTGKHAGKTSGRGTHPTPPAAPIPSAGLSLPDLLSLSGAAGLFLCALAGLGLARQQRLTQFRTTQTYLTAERAAWEKQRSAFDAQRDQLIAELQQAQKHKAELDTLRRHGSHQFEEFFRTLPVACFCVTPTGKVLRWNAACELLYRLPAAQALEKPIWETIIPSARRELMQDQMTRVLAGESLLQVERCDQSADGTALEVRGSMVPLRDAAGQIIGCLSASFGATDLKRHEQQIQAQALLLQEARAALAAAQNETGALRASAADVLSQTSPSAPALIADRTRDALTGLLSHAAFQDRLQTEFDRAARYGNPLSLVFLDLDGFGAYNQAHGYTSGDEALSAVAQMLLSKVRSIDLVARWGADEIAILLPETNRSGALIAAERFRAGVVGLPGDRAPLTASLSLTTLSPDMPHPAALIQRAQETLRGARSGGPGQIAGGEDETRTRQRP